MTQGIDRQTLEHALATGTPFVENRNSALFVYRGLAGRVRIIGDMTEWGESLDLQRFADTDLFFARVELPSNARVEYLLQIDDNAPGPDPSCRHQVLSGLGPNSELAMPDYQYPGVLALVRDGTPGGFDRVTRHIVNGGDLGYEKEIHVYLPPQYDANGKDHPSRYRAIYILDGSDYIEFAHTPTVLDHMIETEVIEPLVAVFISPPNRHLPDPPNRVTEYGLNPTYSDWMADVLVPWVDQHYRTDRDPGSRLVAGDSYAGVGSLFVAFERPHTFGIAHSQSGYLPLSKGQMMLAFANEARRPIRIYLDVGIYEHMVGKDWLPNDEIDFTTGNRAFKSILEDRGYDFVYAEYPEGHTWGNWRVHLIDSLTHYFPARPLRGHLM